MSCTRYDAVYPKRGCYPNKIKSGVSPQLSYPTVTESARGRNRFVLRNVWQTAPEGTLLDKNKKYRGKWANSSFRILNNAGDVLSRKNYSCGGPNMVGSRPGMLNFSYGGGQSKTNCDGTDIPPSTCNVKYVYDSSDFTRYRKLRAVNKGYVAPNFSDGGATGVYSLIRNKQPCQTRCEVKSKRLSYNYDDTVVAVAPAAEAAAAEAAAAAAAAAAEAAALAAAEAAAAEAAALAAAAEAAAEAAALAAAEAAAGEVGAVVAEDQAEAA